jgi:hypothetical protein
MTMLRALSMLSIADRDAVVLVGQRSFVIPALVIVLRRLSHRIWGVWTAPFNMSQ